MSMIAPAFENAFRIPTHHLEPAPLLSAQFISGFGLEREELVVVSPDIGGVKRAQRFQAELADQRTFF
jgi:ribose-phosphate pyrophosphokinase